MVEKHLNKSLLDVAFVDYLALAVFNLALFSSAIDLYFGFSYADEFAMGWGHLLRGERKPGDGDKPVDGNGNRVASTLFGHETVYLVVGSNKLAPDYESALWRARNIAAPKNAQRLNRKTPCAVKGDRCYDCSSPDRICRALVVLWGKPNTVKKMEILLVEFQG